MLKNIFLGVLLLLGLQFGFSQNNNPKIYFDKGGKSTDQEQARYYYRQKTDAANSYKSYYVNGGALFFEGKIRAANNEDENLNVYTGTCIWYYKNGKKKFTRNFNAEGVEQGTSFSYYESGKLWKEVEYSNGQIVNGRYTEYNEDGQSNRIFEEDFSNNNNDWDLYTSDKTSAKISNGSLELSAFTPAGNSRYISLPSQSSEFALEAVINIEKLKDGSKAGIIFGFKDWQNYNYYYISASSFYVGLVYEGVNSISVDGMYSSAIKKKSENSIKIISDGERNTYSINGEIQYANSRSKNFGSNIGFAVSGKSTVNIEKLIFKEIDYKTAASNNNTPNSDMDVKATGSGLLFTVDGYILTNNHVIDNSNKVIIELHNGSLTKSYNATVVQKDIDNDLAILKINDESFASLASIPYSFKESGGSDVGASVFTIGYPLALSGMGKEAKFTDGKISSKTGYNGAINSYQTSIPVQPGNSGGPLFNDKAQLVGVINAGILDADNVSYAIKLSYVKNLIELLPGSVVLPASQSLSAAPLEEKIKAISNYVVLIKIK
ncbi:MAG TPA: trypsin-like peptidase domain-containing protein [Bacteroidia bacterium]|nr:trypsin-like peptidase domain-containing protein [Bacteroidia bacterium]